MKFRCILFGVILSPSFCFSQLNFVDSKQRLGDDDNTVTLADIDNDGDLDAYVLNVKWVNNTPQKRPSQIWLNNGKSEFTLSPQIIGDSCYSSASFADLDGDGDLDLFLGFANYFGGAPNEVWFNDGKGNFTDSGQRMGKMNCGAVLGDLDGDGDIDAFVCNHVFSDGTNVGMQIWLNDGTGTFTDSGQKLGGGFLFGCNLGDIDSDGDLDAIVAYNDGNTGNKIWLNNGKGQFSEGQVISMEPATNCKFADLDNDKDLDIFLLHSDENEVWLNNGAGVFTNSGQKIGTIGSGHVGLGDLDKDGDLDAFLSNSEYQIVKTNEVWINDGTGKFSDSGIRPGTDESKNVELGDLDGDGDLDAFVACVGPSKIWFNQLITTGLHKIPENTDTNILIYPNPANEQITFKMDDLNDLESYSIISVNGKVIKYAELNENTVNLKELNSGIYFLKLFCKDEIIQNKIIIR